jgi:hypothetical protein
MSPEDVADANAHLEAARKRCIYTRGKFCFQSARKCYKGVESVR